VQVDRVERVRLPELVEIACPEVDVHRVAPRQVVIPTGREPEVHEFRE